MQNTVNIGIKKENKYLIFCINLIEKHIPQKIKLRLMQF